MPKPPLRESDYAVELLALTTETSDGQGIIKRLPDGIWTTISFTLDLTAATLGAGGHPRCRD